MKAVSLSCHHIAYMKSVSRSCHHIANMEAVCRSCLHINMEAVCPSCLHIANTKTVNRLCFQSVESKAVEYSFSHVHSICEQTHTRTHARTPPPPPPHTHTQGERERERNVVVFSLHPNIRQYYLTVTGMQEMTLSHPKSSSARKSAVTITRPEDCQGTGGRVTQLPYPGRQGKERAATDVACARTN